VVVSIFVNPTQFGPDEDLNAYPREVEHDLNLLREEGVDLVWTPAAEMLYPSDFQTWVTVEKVSRPLEGAQRPGHMRGVTTVVSKLFNAIQPHRAYFGQKDAQQVQVIRQMVRDLSYPIEIVVCPTVREADGLAMSSRNSYLSPVEREAATVLWRALNSARTAFEAGEHQAGTLRQIMSDVIAAEPLAREQYVSCAHPEKLEELYGGVDHALLSMAVYIGQTRLIDNLEIGEKRFKGEELS
jgi:pantoate--beta-alanine ligase